MPGRPPNRPQGSNKRSYCLKKNLFNNEKEMLHDIQKQDSPEGHRCVEDNFTLFVPGYLSNSRSVRVLKIHCANSLVVSQIFYSHCLEGRLVMQCAGTNITASQRGENS